MNEVTQGPPETNSERLKRLPNVLLAYAKDIEKYGSPLDSGLPGILRFVASQITAQPLKQKGTHDKRRHEKRNS